MLTREQHRYVSICVDRIAGSSQKELARKYTVSESTVKNAVAWGKENGLFETDLSIKLERHIQEFRSRLAKLDEWLHKEFARDEMVREKSGGYEALAAKQLVPIFEEIREHQTKIMELEGLYRQYVNIQNNDNREQNVFIIPQTVESTEDWQKVVEKFKREAGGGGATVQIPGDDYDEE